MIGPENSLLKHPRPVDDRVRSASRPASNAALLEVQGQKILLKPGQWSRWTRLDFALSTPAFAADEARQWHLPLLPAGSAPNFRLYVTPINIDPSEPAVQLSEPPDFVEDVVGATGLFYTTGFQEDHKARSNGVFEDDEFLRQATMVLEERLALFEYAVENYDDGLLFFYFSSSDLQSHMFWWNSDEQHPTRSGTEAQKYFGTSSNSTSDWTRSSATFTTATEARRRSS